MPPRFARPLADRDAVCRDQDDGSAGGAGCPSYPRVVGRAEDASKQRAARAFGRVRRRLSTGGAGLRKAVAGVSGMKDEEMPVLAKQVLPSLVDCLDNVTRAIEALDEQLLAWHRVQPDSQRLATIPGVGVLTATAIIGAIGDGRQFRGGREFAAWIGLVPRQRSSGGTDRLGPSRKRAMPICGGCWCWGRWRCQRRAERKRRRGANGSSS